MTVGHPMGHLSVLPREAEILVCDGVAEGVVRTAIIATPRHRNSISETDLATIRGRTSGIVYKR